MLWQHFHKTGLFVWFCILCVCVNLSPWVIFLRYHQNENWMSQYLFGLYIFYQCSGLHNTSELLCSLKYIPFRIADFNVIVTFLKLSREEKGASGHPSPSPPRVWKAYIIHTALEIPWLMERFFKNLLSWTTNSEKCQFCSHVTAWICQKWKWE